MKQLVAYEAFILPVAPFFRADDTRIACICDDQYTTNLEFLEEINDKKFKLYKTSKAIRMVPLLGTHQHRPCPRHRLSRHPWRRH